MKCIAYKPHNWTIAAIECYKRGCVCKGCLYDDFFNEHKEDYYKHYYNCPPNSRICQMKEAVIELIRLYGIPTEREIRLASITKDTLIKLYVENKETLDYIMHTLRIKKDELYYLLEKFDIPKRIRPKRIKKK